MPTIARQFVKFLGVGAIGTAAHYAILILAVEIAGIPVVFSTAMGFIVGAIINYWLNYHFTFRSSKNHSEAAVKFFLVAAIGLVINTLIVWIVAEILFWPYFLAQIFATGFVLLWTFAANKLWTFSEKI